ncbi:MAG: membrane protein insertion efficiency factor YidD [Spirochaetaceae bacterium]|nr:membrane protein insertion efficiency factor YidD [Spirochaetaceae bacterium]MBR3813703.1 membrane protein insertion efficiency factor YidD [Spirochaetaceae bacterium]MDD6487571.1 membrane protein insertion efficiency factor YidD [Spirochaetales bacterium]
MKRLLSRILCVLIRAYQIGISPFLPKSCRYYPSCSHYAIEAINKYGPFKGTLLASKRILRCHPFHEGGYDPVP